MSRERGIKFEIHRTPVISSQPEPEALKLPKPYGPQHPHPFTVPESCGLQVNVECPECGIFRTLRNSLEMEEWTSNKRYFPYRNPDWADDVGELDLTEYLKVKEATLT